MVSFSHVYDMPLSYEDNILVVMPLSASFILFDLVVHNPSHQETKKNLSLLGVAAGYFSRLEYASGGSVPSSPFSDFVQIAGHYVRDVESGLVDGTYGEQHSQEQSGQSATNDHCSGTSLISVSLP